MEVVYERDPAVGNGFQAYKGRMQSDYVVVTFEGTHFERLLRMLHDNIAAEDTTLVFIRTERPDKPYTLNPELTFLIKTDVEKAIEAMAFPEIRIHIGRECKTPDVLTSCSGTLASAFGHRVLCRHRGRTNGNLLECPGCGRWVPLCVTTSTCNCSDCHSFWQAEVIDDMWCAITVTQLLNSHLSDFFLPREWNNYRTWLSREDLAAKYAEFKKVEEQFNV
jgi:hypothetical protein